MEKEYKNILSKIIKSKRINSGISLIRFSKMNDVSLSTLSRIENNPCAVSDSIFEHVAAKLEIQIPNELCDNLFDELYKSIIDKYDNDYVSDIWNEIETYKDLILESPYFLRYHLYHFTYLQYINQNCLSVDEKEIDYLLENVDLMVDYDKTVLFDMVGTHYYFLKDYEKMREYYFKSLIFKQCELPYARTLSHIVEDYAYEGKYIDAIDCSREAIDIFQKYNLIRAEASAEMNIGNIYSLMGQNDKALEIFKRIDSLEIDELKVTTLNNIILSYVLLNDYDGFLKSLNKINKETLNELRLVFYEFVLKFMLINKDYKRFDLWYIKSKECSKRDKLHDSIIEFYNSYRNELYCEDLGEEVLSLIELPYNTNEFISVASILLKLYQKNGDTRKSEILNEKLNQAIMNSTMANLYK